MSGTDIPARIEFVTFAAPASTNVRPTVHAFDWPTLALRLTSHTEAATKDGMGWSPAVYKRDTRGRLLTRRLDAVDAVTCAVADVEHITLDDLAELLEHVRGLGLAGVVYSTHSHTSTEPRVRLVLPFTEPVPAASWRRLWPALNERVYLGLADRAASDASRMYYLPSTPGDETVIADRWDGSALDWRTLPLADVDAQPSAPVATTGHGAVSTVDPADMPILERLFSGRRGEARMRAWMGDYTDFGGDASAADQSIANGLVAYCHGDTTWAERIMRAGAWRPKWDEPRGAGTWLGATIGKALAAYRAWASTRPAADEPEPDEESPADETPEQTIARQAREIRELRAVNAVQMTNLRAERAEKERLAAQIAGWKVVLSNPKLKPADRIAALPAIEHVLTARANDQAEIHIRYPGIVAGWGLPESTLGKSMDILTERDDAPLAKRSEPGPAVTVETKRGPRTVTPPMVLLRATVDGDLYAAIGAYDPQLPQRGGHREPPPPCPDHPAAEEYVERTVAQCGTCRRPLEPGRERWRTRRQNDALTDEDGTLVVVRTLRRQNDGVTALRVTPRPERYEQPSWLDEWPDHASGLRSYDDVPLTGGAS